MNLAHPRLIRKTPYSDPFLSQPHALIDPSLAPRKAAGCISLSLVVTEVVKLNCLVEVSCCFCDSTTGLCNCVWGAHCNWVLSALFRTGVQFREVPNGGGHEKGVVSSRVKWECHLWDPFREPIHEWADAGVEEPGGGDLRPCQQEHDSISLFIAKGVARADDGMLVLTAELDFCRSISASQLSPGCGGAFWLPLQPPWQLLCQRSSHSWLCLIATSPRNRGNGISGREEASGASATNEWQELFAIGLGP